MRTDDKIVQNEQTQNKAGGEIFEPFVDTTIKDKLSFISDNNDKIFGDACTILN
jgi:hypothetical protein